MPSCGFCRNLGRSFAAVNSHTVRNCQELKTTQCLNCNAYGHTASHCTHAAPVRVRTRNVTVKASVKPVTTHSQSTIVSFAKLATDVAPPSVVKPVSLKSPAQIFTTPPKSLSQPSTLKGAWAAPSRAIFSASKQEEKPTTPASRSNPVVEKTIHVTEMHDVMDEHFLPDSAAELHNYVNEERMSWADRDGEEMSPSFLDDWN